MPQRLLALRLRLAIDRAMADARWEGQVVRLLIENPRGSTSSHVGHNLGAARRAWLARFDANRGEPR